MGNRDISRIEAAASIAKRGLAGYDSSMEPVVNCEEFIGKTVGRRRPIDPLLLNPRSRLAAEAWRDVGSRPRIRKGVYRFNSHEEADQWLMDHLTRKLGS